MVDESARAATTYRVGALRCGAGGLGVLVNDADLVRMVLKGERSAYAELYDRYARLVLAVCYDTTQERSSAEDLLQEAFLRAYRQLAVLRDPDRFGAWVVGIARRVCREWRRSRARENRRRAAFAAVEHPQADCPATDEELERLGRAIGRLPPKERLAVHAFYLMDKSPAQARKRLRRWLGEDREDAR